MCITRLEIAEKSVELRSTQGEFLALLTYGISISNFLSLAGKYLCMSLYVIIFLLLTSIVNKLDMPTDSKC